MRIFRKNRRSWRFQEGNFRYVLMRFCASPTRFRRNRVGTLRKNGGTERLSHDPATARTPYYIYVASLSLHVASLPIRHDGAKTTATRTTAAPENRIRRNVRLLGPDRLGPPVRA